MSDFGGSQSRCSRRTRNPTSEIRNPGAGLLRTKAHIMAHVEIVSSAARRDALICVQRELIVAPAPGHRAASNLPGLEHSEIGSRNEREGESPAVGDIDRHQDELAAPYSAFQS